MKRNGRLSASLHALVHMAQKPERSMTSEHIATWLQTNPVVVRRMVAGLRDAGILAATRGPGGGLALARDPAAISVADVVAALGEHLMPFNTEAESPGCLVERAVNKALDDVRDDMERILMQRLGDLTIADLAASCGPAITDYRGMHHGH